MELLEAIEISALKSVLQPDDDYFLRRIFRWYSEKFHTPLGEVADLPVEDVLQTYFECAFEHMTKRKLGAYAKKLTKPPAAPKKPKKPRKPRAKKENKLSDDDFTKMMKDKSVDIVKTLEARNEEKRKAAKNMMDSLDDMDPLAPLNLPEINSKFNSNLE
jgi:primosomal protein N'